MAHEPSSYDKVCKMFKDKDSNHLLFRSWYGVEKGECLHHLC